MRRSGHLRRLAEIGPELNDRGAVARCGLQVIDLRSGDVAARRRTAPSLSCNALRCPQRDLHTGVQYERLAVTFYYGKPRNVGATGFEPATS